MSEVALVVEPAEVPEDAESAEDAGIAEAPAPAQCTRESLEAVGVVVLDALEVITARLAKVDRFAKTPLASIEDVVAVPRGADASDREDEVEQEAATTEEAEPPSPEVEAESEAAAVAEAVEEAKPQLAEVSDSTSAAALASTEEIVGAPASEAGGEPACQVQENASESDPWAKDEEEIPEESSSDCGGRPCAWGQFPK